MCLANQIIFTVLEQPELGFGVHFSFTDLINKFMAVHGAPRQSYGMSAQGFISANRDYCVVAFRKQTLIIWKSTINESDGIVHEFYFGGGIKKTHKVSAWTREEVDPTLDNVAMWLIDKKMPARDKHRIIEAHRDKMFGMMERFNTTFIQALANA